MSSFVELLNEGMGESIEYDITEDTIPNKQIYGTFKLNGETYGMSFVKTTTNRHFTFEFWRLATKNKRMWDIRKGSDWNVIVPTLMRFLEMCYTMSKPVCDSIIIRIPSIPKIAARQKFLERIIRKSFIKTMNYVPVKRLTEQKFTHLYLVKKGVDPKALFNGAVFKKHFEFDVKETEAAELINDETLEVMSEPYRRQKPFPSLRPTKLAFGAFALDTDDVSPEDIGKEIDAIASVLLDPSKVRKVNQTFILSKHDGKTPYTKIKPEDVVQDEIASGPQSLDSVLQKESLEVKYVILKAIVTYATLWASGKSGYSLGSEKSIEEMFYVNLKNTAARDLPYSITRMIVAGKWLNNNVVIQNNFIGLMVDWAHLTSVEHEHILKHLFATTNIAEFFAAVEKAIKKYKSIVDWQLIFERQDTDLATIGKFSATILSELEFGKTLIANKAKKALDVRLISNALKHTVFEPYFEKVRDKDAILYSYWTEKLGEMSDFEFNLTHNRPPAMFANVMMDIIDKFINMHISNDSSSSAIITWAKKVESYKPVGFNFRVVDFITATSPEFEGDDVNAGHGVTHEGDDKQSVIKNILEKFGSSPHDMDAILPALTVSQAILVAMALPAIGHPALTGPLLSSENVEKIKKVYESNWRKHKTYGAYKFIISFSEAKKISKALDLVQEDTPYKLYSSLLKTQESPSDLTWEDIHKYVMTNTYRLGDLPIDNSVVDAMDKLHKTSKDSFLMHLAVGMFAQSGANFKAFNVDTKFDLDMFIANLYQVDTWIANYLSDIGFKSKVNLYTLESFIKSSYMGSNLVGDWVKKLIDSNPDMTGEDVVTTMQLLGVKLNRLLFAKEEGDVPDSIKSPDYDSSASYFTDVKKVETKNKIVKSERLDIDFELDVPDNSPFKGDSYTSAGHGHLGFQVEDAVTPHKKGEYLKTFPGVTDSLNRLNDTLMYNYTGSSHSSINNSAREIARFELKNAIKDKRPMDAKGISLADYIKDYEKLAISIEVPFWVYRNTSIPDVDDYQVGDDLIDPAFLSTTIDSDMGYGQGTSRLKIFVPAGTKFVPAFGVGQNGSENEVILPPFSVNRITERTDVERAFSRYCFVCVYSGSAYKSVLDYGQPKTIDVVENLADLRALIEAKIKKPDVDAFGKPAYNPNEKWGGELFNKSKDIAKLIKTLKDKKDK